MTQKNLITSAEYDAKCFRMAKAIQRGFNKSGYAPDWVQCSNAGMKVIAMVWSYKSEESNG